MSIITLQFGQCGNQIGRTLFSDLYNDIITNDSKIVNNKRYGDYATESVNKWFSVNKSDKWEPRSILIDTENKVASMANDDSFYKFKNVIAKSHGGSANNWAYGYSEKSKLLLNDIVEGVRKEVEKCDSVSSILSLLSCGGGTGSGVGSRIIEVLHDLYPNKNMINAIVLPYISGEVVTQNYNSLLTLAKLYDITDLTYIYENDVIHQMSIKFLSLSSVTFSDLNSLIAQQLASVLQPVAKMTVSEIVSNLAAHPSYKFIQIRSVPHTSKEHKKYEPQSTWISLVNSVRSLLKFNYGIYDLKLNNRVNKKIKCISNILMTRGITSPLEEDLRPLSDVILYVPWTPKEFRLLHYHQPRTFKDLNKFVSLSSNSNAVCFPLNLILEDFGTTFSSGAYLHHYKKFGVDEESFVTSFEKVEQIFNDYNKL